MKDIILDILKTRGSISLKKLQKKSDKQISNKYRETEISPKVIKKFNKKIDKLKELEVNDGLVILKSVDDLCLLPPSALLPEAETKGDGDLQFIVESE
ncbi:hypothetical protein NQ317_003749 [Molorchus minor]|uniref:Cell growth-regulating nucleolar protein-like winged helix domain-containing protein n=1 Tax=Molorchus minor TaxID=1323400 RepID=A0ABQ9JPN9_9CUCU|nr:hypothetical protein NQ317_003749 [Molorchus minor]